MGPSPHTWWWWKYSGSFEYFDWAPFHWQGFGRLSVHPCFFQVWQMAWPASPCEQMPQCSRSQWMHGILVGLRTSWVPAVHRLQCYWHIYDGSWLPSQHPSIKGTETCYTGIRMTATSVLGPLMTMSPCNLVSLTAFAWRQILVSASSCVQQNHVWQFHRQLRNSSILKVCQDKAVVSVLARSSAPLLPRFISVKDGCG